MVITNSLRNLNYIERIDKASNGQEAFDLVMKNEQGFSSGTSTRYYDLVLLDLNMPIVDGFEACKLILNFYE